MPVGDESVARVLAREDRRQLEPCRQVGRDVLHRVHRDVGAAIGQGTLQLLHEQALAAGLIEPLVDQLVAASGHGKQPQLEARMLRLEALLHVLSLPPGEAAAASGDRKALHGLSATSSRSTGHWRRLTGRRSTMPSSTTSQWGSSGGPSAARSKPRIAARATRQLR